METQKERGTGRPITNAHDKMPTGKKRNPFHLPTKLKGGGGEGKWVRRKRLHFETLLFPASPSGGEEKEEGTRMGEGRK